MCVVYIEFDDFTEGWVFDSLEEATKFAEGSKEFDNEFRKTVLRILKEE